MVYRFMGFHILLFRIIKFHFRTLKGKLMHEEDNCHPFLMGVNFVICISQIVLNNFGNVEGEN